MRKGAHKQMPGKGCPLPPPSPQAPASMEKYGKVWKSMEKYGKSMEEYGKVWKSMELPRPPQARNLDKVWKKYGKSMEKVWNAHGPLSGEMPWQ